MTMDLLNETPNWVFVLFGILCLFSIQQSQARQAGITQLLTFSFLLLCYSLGKVVSFNTLAGIAYLVTLGICGYIILQSSKHKEITLSKNGRNLVLDKNYLRGAGIMGIFFIQYYSNVRHAITGDSLSTIEYAAIACGLAVSSSPHIALACKGLQIRLARRSSLKQVV